MSEAIFFNVWRTASTADREALIAAMRDESDYFTGKPGFLSMRAWACEEDGRVLIEGRWGSAAAFDAAVATNPEAAAGRERLARYGSPEPGLFTPIFEVVPDPSQVG